MLDFSSKGTRKALAEVLNKVAQRVEEEESFARFLFEDLLKAVQVVEKPMEQEKKKQSKGKTKSNALHELDVFAVYAKEGEKGLELRLESLEVVELKAIVNENGFDPAKKVSRWKTKSKIVAFLVDVVKSRVQKGEAFLKI